MTDGNYTVAWLVADENDGAGYYEDDEDDQVLVNLCLLCIFLYIMGYYEDDEDDPVLVNLCLFCTF